jgi:tetratricopeptide (TPR) repeat protein
MAKQRRVKSRPQSKPVQPPRPNQISARPAPVAAPRPEPPSPAPRPPVVRAGYADAVALYEQGVAALQSHEYSRASTLFRSVLSGYPDEKELHERARLYLNICERQVESRAAGPKSPEEHIFAATVAFNAADYEQSLTHLRAATKEAPDHDHALYMMAATLALRDEREEAVPFLLRAIELNPENRAMARHDPDLESLRDHDQVRAALDTVPTAKAERRKASPRRLR